MAALPLDRFGIFKNSNWHYPNFCTYEASKDINKNTTLTIMSLVRLIANTTPV